MAAKRDFYEVLGVSKTAKQKLRKHTVNLPKSIIRTAIRTMPWQQSGLKR